MIRELRGNRTLIFIDFADLLQKTICKLNSYLSNKLNIIIKKGG